MTTRHSARPFAFLLHINDLPSVVNSKVQLFAADCLIYREIKTINDQNDLQKDLNVTESVMAYSTGP